MHVKDLHVTRYGPMAPFEADGLGAFTVVYGPNEQGKTLLIDALFKLLFKKELKRTKERRFGNMKRVSEQPEGYVVLRTHADEVKLETDDTLLSCFPVDIDPDDFRNVFLVRDSDLQILEERDYYARITERLTGLRSSEMESLLKVIRDKGRLKSTSPDSALANRADHGKVADRVRAARHVVEEIKAVRDALAFERYDELADELSEVRRARHERGEERDRFRAAERRRRAQRARAALAEFEELNAALASMNDLDDGLLRNWRRLVAEREHLERDIARGEAASEKLAADRVGAEEVLRARRAAADEAERRYREVERDLSPLIDRYQHARLEFRRHDPVSALTRWSFAGAGALAVAAAVVYAVRPGVAVAVVGAAALLFAARTGWVLRAHARTRADLEREAVDLLAAASRFGIQVDTALDLQSAVGDLEGTTRGLRDEEREQDAAVERIRADIARQGERLTEQRARIAAIDADVTGLKATTRAPSPEEYQAVLDRRTSLRARRTATRELLQNLVPIGASESQPDAAERWRAAIDEVLAPDDGAADSSRHDDADAERGAQLEREIRELEARESDLGARLGRGGKRLYNMQMKAVDLGVLDEVPRCRTLHDLDHLAAQIEGYCAEVEHRQSIAQQTIGLLQEIDAEERAKVGELFGPASRVSTLFREITDGRYRSVGYDTEQDQIYVEQNNGKPLRATALSGGAFDQLYLCIRLSIAEKLLPASKGFFIMDDPFIKADLHRLGTLMETLRRFVRDGWQILYFSAKQEVLDVLAPDFRSGAATLIELNRTLFSAPVIEEPALGTKASPPQIG